MTTTITATGRKPWEIRMGWKAWSDYADTPLWGPESRKLSGSNGIYELADENLRILYVGYAGSRSRFGLRGVLKDRFSDTEPNSEINGKVRYFRYEVTSAYLSRWVEVIARHHQRGSVPIANLRAKEYPRKMPYFGPGQPA